MAKVTTTITDKQSGTKQTHGREVIPQPVLSQSAVRGVKGVDESRLPQQKPRYALLNADGKIVATLIDEALAEKWVADHKKGAIKFVKGGAA